MADHLLQEDGTSKLLLEDGTGSLLLETSPSGTATTADARFGAAIPGWPYFGDGAGETDASPIASPGAVAVTAAPATLTTTRLVSATAGSFTTAGTAASFQLLLAGQHSSNLDAATYTISSPDASLVFVVARHSAVGRVNIAFNDGPLEPNPVWTRVDDNDVFPDGLVAGYDITIGRQSLISQTDTGTATVYLNDHELALFDPRNTLSPYFGLLDGKQILLQLQNPVTGVWESQFRGLIADVTYDIDGAAVNTDGDPINTAIQIECVDIFDYLAGYGLTPGLDGVSPPAGSEDVVYYAPTAGSVQDRILEILTDATSAAWVTDMTNTATGNVRLLEGKYDPDEAALTALRDCADAELPFIANIYVDRNGRFCFRGRYSRFDPDSVAAEPTSDWDFQRWAVGDGAAIGSDPTRAQMRVLSYTQGRSNIINAAISYPQGLAAADMPGQVYADTASITAYGKHTPPGPLSDLLVSERTHGGVAGRTECLNYATLLVKNQKDPRPAITALRVTSVMTDGSERATRTWKLLTQADISDIVNVAAGYPAGVGFAGDSPDDDYYIEGRTLTVRPANTTFDHVELDLEVSPAVWSMDTHGVFPAFPG